LAAKFLTADNNNTVHQSSPVIIERWSWAVPMCSIANPHTLPSSGLLGLLTCYTVWKKLTTDLPNYLRAIWMWAMICQWTVITTSDRAV